MITHLISFMDNVLSHTQQIIADLQNYSTRCFKGWRRHGLCATMLKIRVSVGNIYTQSNFREIVHGKLFDNDGFIFRLTASRVK